MRVAVDTSVLLDVLGADPAHGEASREALRAAYDKGALVAWEVVWAEVRAHFSSEAAFEEAVSLLGIVFEGMSPEAAARGGKLWREFRREAGAGRQRVIADFLVAAHAMLHADALLSRDRGFYGRRFKGLRVLDPGSARRTK